MTHAPRAHQPVMLAEVLAALRPAPGDRIVDCTLGAGGHAEALLSRIQPGGRLLGLDVDQTALEQTTPRLSAGRAEGALATHHGSFADVRHAMHAHGLSYAEVVFADLGISSWQADDPSRGFHHKGVGPLDMRMNPRQTTTAATLLAELGVEEVAMLLREGADEPFADLIAPLITGANINTTHHLARVVRLGLGVGRPSLSKPDIKMSVRRVFQALRIAVNGELDALDRLLADLPSILAPGGRAAILTFHSGEDRRVTHAFLEGHRLGVYASISRAATQSSRPESFANRRSRPAKLRWVVRALA